MQTVSNTQDKLTRLICIIFFLGANAPLGPASSEGLYVCPVCMCVCNNLAPLPFSPLTSPYPLPPPLLS